MPSSVSLLSLSQIPAPVLTVYLDTNQAQYINQHFDHGHLSWFRNEAKHLLTHVSDSDRVALSAELERVTEFLMQDTWGHRGMALFAGPGTWIAIPLDREPQNQIDWGEPRLWQLWAIADRCPRTCIAMIDLSGARLFYTQYGTLIPLETIDFHIDVSQWKEMQSSHAAERGMGLPHGAQQDIFERRRKSQYMHLFWETAKKIAHACEVYSLTRILLFGADRLTIPVEHRLPLNLQDRAIRLRHMRRDLVIADLLAHFEDQLRTWESARREQEVDEFLNRKHGIVTGVEDTLTELQRGRVSSLLVAEDFNPALHLCVQCGHATASAVQDCPRCHGKVFSTTLHEILPQLLGSWSSDMKLLRGAAAERLRSAGSIGGWVRIRPHVAPVHFSRQQTWPAAGPRVTGITA